MVAQLDRLVVRRRPLKAAGRLLAWGLFEGRPGTSRARFLNGLAFATMGLAARIHPGEGEAAPVLLLGNGRSGTTLLGRVIGFHRDVLFLNEPRGWWHFVEPRQDVLGNFSSRPDARFHLDPDGLEPAQRHRAHAVLGALRRLTGSREILDKNGELLFRLPYVQALFGTFRAILITRDAGPTIRSVVAWDRAEGRTVQGKRHGWWGRDGLKWRLTEAQLLDEAVRDDLGFASGDVVSEHDRAAAEWAVTNRQGLLALADPTFGASILHLRYEALVTAPLETLGDVNAFLGLREDPGQRRYAGELMRPGEVRAQESEAVLRGLSPAVREGVERVRRRLGYAEAAP